METEGSLVVAQGRAQRELGIDCTGSAGYQSWWRLCHSVIMPKALDCTLYMGVLHGV